MALALREEASGAGPSPRARCKQSTGTTPTMIRDILFAHMPDEILQEAKDTGTCFAYKLKSPRSRANDCDALYPVRDILYNLIVSNGNSCVIDKTCLEQGLTCYFVDKMKVEIDDIGSLAYSLKLMLMQIDRTKRNTTTGARLSPWLRRLVAVASATSGHYELSEEEGAEEGESNETTGAPAKRPSMRTSGGSVPVTRRRILMREPTTPSVRSTPRRLRRGEDHSDVDETECEEGDEVGGEKGKAYIYMWNEAEGGIRMPIDGPGEHEPCDDMQQDDSGFIRCFWTSDGGEWLSETPNGELKHFAGGTSTAPMRRPASRATTMRRPAAGLRGDGVASNTHDDGDDVVRKRPAGKRAPKSSPRKLLYASVYHKRKNKALSDGKSAASARSLGRKAANVACAKAGL